MNVATPFLRHLHVVFDVASCLLNLSIILSFKSWFLAVHGVCHLDFGGGNPHVKYLCAVANFYDEYYLVIGPFWIF